jgi:hypothetical protein
MMRSQSSPAPQGLYAAMMHSPVMADRGRKTALLPQAVVKRTGNSFHFALLEYLKRGQTTV